MIKKYTKKDGSTAYMFTAYLGVYPVTGKQKRAKKQGFKTKREASIAEAKLLADVQQYGFTNLSSTTFNEVATLWLEQYQKEVRESSYAITYNMMTKHILPKFGHMKVKDITPLYCQKALNDWHKHFTSFKKYKNYTKAILKHAIQLGVIHSNPFDNVRVPRQKDKAKQEELLYYSTSELKQFLELVEQEGNQLFTTLFRLLAFTGARKGELAALTWDDINFSKKTLTINKSLAYGEKGRAIINPPKSKASNRTISLDDKTLQYLHLWKIEQRKELFRYGIRPNKPQYLFTDITTNRPLPRAKSWSFMLELCNKHHFKRIKIHGFRHTHCSLLFEAGLSVKEVQSRLGHSNITTTMDIYTHVTEKQQEETAKKFAQYVNF